MFSKAIINTGSDQFYIYMVFIKPTISSICITSEFSDSVCKKYRCRTDMPFDAENCFEDPSHQAFVWN